LPFVSGGVGPHLPLVHGGVGPLLLFVPGAVGPSLPFAHGGLGPLFAMRGAGGLSFFVGGGAGGLLHCSWVVVVCPCLAVSGWWWCALIGFCAPWYMALVTVVVVLSLFKGEGGGWSFMFAGAPSIIDCIVSVCCCCMLSSLHVLSITCPHRCCVFLPCCCLVPSLSLSHVVVVAVPSL